MCLKIQKTFASEHKARKFARAPLIAEEDVKVYKVLRKNGLSPHQDFKYEKGYHYSVKRFTYKLNWFVNGRTKYDFEVRIYEGLHSYRIKTAAHKVNPTGTWNKMIVAMYVPKGAKYFMEGDQVVSTELVWYKD